MKNIIRFVFVFGLGLLYGLFFAQKSGKKLRTELSKSENPSKKLWEELRAVEKDSRECMVDWVEGSESLQKLVQGGKEQLDHFVESVHDLSDEAKVQAQKALEELSKNAKEAAQKLSAGSVKKGKDVLDKIS